VSPLRIVLVSLGADLAEAWKQFCGDVDGVEVFVGDVVASGCDAVVSPANSFGFMDGGIDARYLHHFGNDIQDAVRLRIQERHGGELLVGMADIVETGADPAFLIVAPTMRVPMRLVDSVNPYLAARAVLRLLLHGTFIDGRHAGSPIIEIVKSVAIPGLGTGVGGIRAETCSRRSLFG
jgi:O-acetyl-ADP-ribose deacetylase (regulator of RNase III)